ncbi:MAG: DUF951 domain-containing protein [Chloroflexi bacterium]|nr:DUF951 domain-containing protein [Chloroflexota bacterium]
MLDVQLKDRVTMRKTHPCGSVVWVCVRVGADIGLKCTGCGRIVQMPRSQFNRQAKRIEKPQNGATDA